MTEQKIHDFIAYLQGLEAQNDRAALAALRRGLGLPPGAAPQMFPFVEPLLPSQRSQKLENACYLIASLFALHPAPGGKGNMGDHFRQADPEGKGKEALERRFTVLLAAHPEDLPDYLRQAVSFLKSKDSPVDWNQLFWDILAWDDEDRRVQKRWARAFWSRPIKEETPS
ncbi:MAG: type I-E CRISPR-associated protein Cse2/CasB [Chloroflexota bacterium]